MRSTPAIFSYAPASPNGRPSRTAERCVIWNDVTAIGSVPPAGASAPRLHERQLAAPEESPRVRGQAQVERDDVGGAEDLVLGRGPGPERGDRGGVPARAVGENLHAERLGQRDDAGADLAGAEDTQRLAEELGEQIAGPSAASHLAVDVRDTARGREHQRQGVLCHREGVDTP